MSKLDMINNLLNYGMNEHYNMLDERDNDQTTSEQIEAEKNVLISMSDDELKELFNATIDNEALEMINC